MTKVIDFKTLKIDRDMNDDYSYAEEILFDGFNKNYPIVINENGFILDGNHRYEMFKAENRLNEISVMMITEKEFFELKEKDSIRFCEDDDYFYELMNKYGVYVENFDLSIYNDCQIDTMGEMGVDTRNNQEVLSWVKDYAVKFRNAYLETGYDSSLIAEKIA